MSNIAINDAGDVLVYDGQNWKTAPMAANDAGDKVVFDGTAWKPLGQLMAASKGQGDAKRSTSDNVAQAFGQGATFGFGDEMTAGLRAAAPGLSNFMMSPPALERDESIGGSPPPPPSAPGMARIQGYGQTVSTAPTIQGRYDEELARERAKAQQFQKDSPTLATGSNIAGSIASALLATPASVARGGGLLVNALRGARTGAILGGVQGFGEGEGGFDARMENAAKGAAYGTALGGVAPVIGRGVGEVYERAAPFLLNKAANVAEQYVPKAVLKSGSAAAPEGGPMIPASEGAVKDTVATRIADAARNAAGRIEDDTAVKRIALELSRSGGTDQARAALSNLGQDAFLADTSKGVQRLANVGYILPGEAADRYAVAFDARNRAAGTRFANTLPDTPSVADTQQFFKGYKQQTGSKLYDPVLRGGPGSFSVSPEMQEVMGKRQVVRDVMKQIEDELTYHGQKPTEAEVAHLVKRTLNANTEAAFNAGRAINKNAVQAAGDAWEEALYKANPGIQAADEAYAKVASLSNKKTGEGLLERGQKFMQAGTSQVATDMSPSALARDLPQLNPQQRQAFQVGSTDTLRNLAEAGPKSTRRVGDKLAEGDFLLQKMEQIYGPAKAAEIVKQAKTEKAFGETANSVMRGSPTAQRLASLGDEFALGSGVPTTPMGIASALLGSYQKMRQPSEAVRAKIADMIANPSAGENRQLLAIVDALLQRQATGNTAGAAALGSAAGRFVSP